MKRYGRPRRRPQKRKRIPFRGGVLLVGLVAALFLLADRGGLDRLLSGGGSGDAVHSGSSDVTAEVDSTGDVTRIVDDDIFWVSDQDERIRVCGLDAPKVGNAAGFAATVALTRPIKGQTVRCRVIHTERELTGKC